MNARELLSLQKDFESLCTTPCTIQKLTAPGVWGIVETTVCKVIDPRTVTSPFSLGAGIAAKAMSLSQGRVIALPMRSAANTQKDRRVVTASGTYRIADENGDLDDQAGLVTTAQKLDV